MQVIIRDVTIRGEVEYIIDSGDGLAPSRQLSLLMQASYNSLITNPKILEVNPDWAEHIQDLKVAVEKFLNATS